VLRHPRRQLVRKLYCPQVFRHHHTALSRPPPPLLHPLDTPVSLFPSGKKRKQVSRLAKEAQRGSKHGVRATVQTDVAVVRLSFGPSLSLPGYGVGSPRSRKLLRSFQTLPLWSAQRSFLVCCCRTEGAGRRVSLRLIGLEKLRHSYVTDLNYLFASFASCFPQAFCWVFSILFLFRPSCSR